MGVQAAWQGINFVEIHLLTLGIHEHVNTGSPLASQRTVYRQAGSFSLGIQVFWQFGRKLAVTLGTLFATLSPALTFAFAALHIFGFKIKEIFALQKRLFQQGWAQFIVANDRQRYFH